MPGLNVLTPAQGFQQVERLGAWRLVGCIEVMI